MEAEISTVLARARQGDSEAFRMLVERHSRSAFRLAYRMTGNDHDAEDVVQDSFLRAYRQLARFESRAPFGTWLHRIVANCSWTSCARPISPGLQLGAETWTPSSNSHRRMSPAKRLVRSAESTGPAGGPGAAQPAGTRRVHVATLRGRSIAEISRTRQYQRGHSVFRAVRKLRAALAPIRGES
jgi:RNA polymerase sigma-70 factor (ECF subfamily)